MVEAARPDLVHDLAVVQRCTPFHLREAHHVADVTRVHGFALQAVHNGIVDPRCQVGDVSGRWPVQVRSVHSDEVATRELVEPSRLHPEVEEAVHRALAFGSIGETAVAHITHAPEGAAGERGTHIGLHVLPGLLVLSEGVHQTGVDVVVPTEHVTFFHHLVRAVQVVERDQRVIEVTVCELVDVHPEVATQQVFNRFKVVCALVVDAAAHGEVARIIDLFVPDTVDAYAHRIRAHLFQDVFAAVAGDRLARTVRVLHGVQVLAVGEVHLVPIDLASGGVVAPYFLPAAEQARIGLLVVAGQVAVIIRTGIFRIEPVEARGSVATEGVEQAGGPVHLPAFVEVAEHEHRLVVEGHACIALLAILVAPVRVVVVRSAQVEGFLYSHARTALHDGGAEAREAHAVPLIDLVLGGQEVCIGIEGGAFHIPFFRPPARTAEAERPAVLEKSRGACNHHPVAVSPVG